MEINYQTTLNNLFSDLSPRRKEILERRFGLKTGQRETLQSIGDDLSITRERVRQLINDSLGLIKERRAQYLERPIRYFVDYFQDNGGLKRETKIFEDFVPKRYRGHASFFLTIGPEFKRFNEDEDYHTFWAVDKDMVGQARKTIDLAIRELEQKRELLSVKEFRMMIDKGLGENVFISYIEISKNISQSPDGFFGLISWPEINPRGVRDGAYLVLKGENKPLHFIKITNGINRLPYGKRNVLPESVHNELIRSPLFVLIGRGIYALKEWGYEPGTVKEIIIKVLKESKRPLSREEVLRKVLDQREVKENTVLLNLQDRKYFIRTDRGRFGLK